MYDSADLRKRPVQLQMCCRIRGRAVASFYFITVQIHHNHILRGQLIILHTAWLNDKQPAFSVDSADVAPGKGHQTIPGQIHVRFIYCFFEFFQHRFLPVFCRYFAALQFAALHLHLFRTPVPQLFPLQGMPDTASYTSQSLRHPPDPAPWSLTFSQQIPGCPDSPQGSVRLF